MTKLRVPTLQHLARNWNSDPNWICKSLVRLANNPPNFNYELLFRLARDLLLFGQPYDEVLAAVKRIKRLDLQARFLEVLPLLRDYFEGQRPDYFQDIEPRHYSVGRGLMVPFAPPFIYSIGGQIYFPWLSFWRSNPLSDERLALFVTIVRQILLDDPDLENSIFHIVDFSAPTPKSERSLRVIDASEVPILPERRVREMLEIFAEGYFRAEEELNRHSQKQGSSQKVWKAPAHEGQENLFDWIVAGENKKD